MKEITGRGSPSTGGNGQKLTSAIYYIYNSGGQTVRADVSGVKGTSSEITLVDDSPIPSSGFTNAHKIFSPDLILSIIYGEFPKRDIPKKINEAYS